MARRERQANRLLDHWVPPSGAGEPVGCVATTFTFDSVFFEEECLTRFAQVESDPQEDGPAYLIEREEKLASLACAVVLVDQHHCKGSRSLRWDLVPVRVADGIMHAKVSVLVWTHLVRVIVASANLTPAGYRTNQEIFGVLEHVLGSGPAPAWLAATVAFLRALLPMAGAAEAPDVGRVRGLLGRVEALAPGAPAGEAQAAQEGPEVTAVYLQPDSGSVLEQLGRLWPGGGPIGAARVTSPFYDDPGRPNEPARLLWGMLRQRGEAEVTWYAPGQKLEDGESVLLYAPVKELAAGAPRSRPGVTTKYMLAAEQGLERDGGTGAFRPLHMKSLILSDADRALVMMGSSNFTSAGLGTGARGRNIEANLVYLISKRRHEREWRAIDGTLPEAEEVPADKARGEVAPDVEGENRAGEAGLPAFFASAVYDVAGGGFVLRLGFTAGAGAAPASWRIASEEGPVLYDDSRWTAAGAPAAVEVPAPPGVPPSGLVVEWATQDGAVRSWWPIVVASGATLPPPDELRDLPLEALLEVISSARPVYSVLGRWLARKQGAGGEGGAALVVDPLERVDSSGFILQRTRRVSWALGALRRRLERPCATREQLAWRLAGPVGVDALAAAIEREAQTPEERVFLLAELALELSRVQPAGCPGGLAADEVRTAIGEAIERLAARAAEAESGVDASLVRYAKLAFEEARA